MAAPPHTYAASRTEHKKDINYDGLLLTSVVRPHWEIALLAALIMVVQDILNTAQTQASTRGKASLSGLPDMASWLVTISTATLSVTALQGHGTAKKIVVIGAVSSASYVGSVLGVKIGDRSIKQKSE